MSVYRITLSKWAGNLTGTGIPARWNSRGVEMIYTAGSRSLVCLENLVHRSGEGLNRNFSIIEIDIPDNCTVEHLQRSLLPEYWYRMENYSLCQKIGNNWIESRNSPVLRVPSSIIPEEFNYLINPRHPDAPGISIKTISPYRFDERLT